MNRKNLKFKCFNSKCTNTTPRPDDRLFGAVEYICDKCGCSMEVIKKKAVQNETEKNNEHIIICDITDGYGTIWYGYVYGNG